MPDVADKTRRPKTKHLSGIDLLFVKCSLIELQCAILNYTRSNFESFVFLANKNSDFEGNLNLCLKRRHYCTD